MPELSAADPNFVKVFPKNAEFAAQIAFRSDEPKEEINNIVPGGRHAEHHRAAFAHRAA